MSQRMLSIPKISFVISTRNRCAVLLDTLSQITRCGLPLDEFDIHVMPVLIGEGIPLVAPRHRDVPLRLRSSRKYPDGVVRLRYEVAR